MRNQGLSPKCTIMLIFLTILLDGSKLATNIGEPILNSYLEVYSSKRYYYSEGWLYWCCFCEKHWKILSTKLHHILCRRKKFLVPYFMVFSYIKNSESIRSRQWSHGFWRWFQYGVSLKHKIEDIILRPITLNMLTDSLNIFYVLTKETITTEKYSWLI